MEITEAWYVVFICFKPILTQSEYKYVIKVILKKYNVYKNIHINVYKIINYFSFQLTNSYLQYYNF